jgi:NitT/TauT family transport system substrate-binding protein
MKSKRQTFSGWRGVGIAVVFLGALAWPKTLAIAASEPLAELRLGYFANVTHAQAVLGVANGDFQKALGVTKLKALSPFNAGPSLIEAMVAGDVDIGYVGPGPALTAWAQTHGKEITVIAGAAADGVLIVARPGSGIQTLTDLKGKKIATPQKNNTQDISARHYVLSVLNETNDKNVINVSNSEQAGRMKAGDFDAAWVPEPWGSRLIAAGGTLVAAEKDLWPDHQFSLTVVIVRTQFLHDHPEAVKAFLTVHRDLTKKLNDSPQTYAAPLGDALFALTKSKFPPGVLESSLKNVKFTVDPLKSTFDTMEQWSIDLRVIRSKVSLDGLFDTSILEGLP